MFIGKKRILADTDPEMMDDSMDMDEGAEGAAGGVDVAPEASDLLFEAEDVAELLAEVTGEPVEVTADQDTVVFAVGDEEFTVEAEGDEEVLESVRKPLRGKRPVSASRKSAASKRPVAASRRVPPRPAKTGKTIRKLPSSK